MKMQQIRHRGRLGGSAGFLQKYPVLFEQIWSARFTASQQGLGQAGRMYTIVAASQKGGSGKTTLSGHLAVEAARAGAGEIALIDTDPQGSLAAWWNARQAPTPHFVRKRGLPDLDQALAELSAPGSASR